MKLFASLVLGAALVAFAGTLGEIACAQEGSEDSVLTVDAGQSRMIRLARPVASVSLANPAVADVQVVSAEVLLVYGKVAGRTSLVVLGDGGDLVARWIIAVTLDVGPVRSALLEDADLRNVKVRPWRQGVELSGTVQSAEAAEQALQLARASLPEKTTLINRLFVSTPQQVNLEVQIAEVQRSVSESLGINWEALNTRSDGRFGFRVGRLLLDNTFPGAAFPEGQASALFGTHASGSASVRVLIDALATAGLATVLARPNVTAVSGERASFFSGGEYPLPSGIKDGQITFDYKKYGVLLDFVPTVINSERISLTVRPEVSQRVTTEALRILDAEIPVIDVRRAETTIEVGDGESIVIAGLYRNQGDSRETGVPGIKDVPGLGPLFGNRTVRSNSTELIVVVTARLTTSAQAGESTERLSSRRVQGYHY